MEYAYSRERYVGICFHVVAQTCARPLGRGHLHSLPRRKVVGREFYVAADVFAGLFLALPGFGDAECYVVRAHEV